MQLSVGRVGQALVAAVEGELDLATAPAFRRKIEESWQRWPNVVHLILVLTGLRFVDSSGLGAILGRLRAVESRGGRMVLVAPPPPALRVLEMGGLLRRAAVAGSEESALALLERKGPSSGRPREEKPSWQR